MVRFFFVVSPTSWRAWSIDDVITDFYGKGVRTFPPITRKRSFKTRCDFISTICRNLIFQTLPAGLFPPLLSLTGPILHPAAAFSCRKKIFLGHSNPKRESCFLVLSHNFQRSKSILPFSVSLIFSIFPIPKCRFRFFLLQRMITTSHLEKIKVCL